MPNVPAIAPSDEDLVGRARRGCAASFEQIVRRFQAPVLQFLRRRGAGADAEDLLQESFVRAFTNLHRYRNRWRFATWLFTIARRVSINHHRRSKAAASDSFESAPSPGREPVEVMAEEESRRNLWDLAGRVLSEDEVTALWLFYVEEMPVREIAGVLERSRTGVKTMMCRARKKLQPLVAAEEADALQGRTTNRRSSESPRMLGIEVSNG